MAETETRDLNTIRADLKARLNVVRAAAEEARQLEAMLRVLDTERPSADRHSQERQIGRAPRGSNKAAIVKTVGERPGITVAELARETRIDKATVYTAAGKMVKDGTLALEKLPGGQNGYRVPPAPQEPSTS